MDEFEEEEEYVYEDDVSYGAEEEEDYQSDSNDRGDENRKESSQSSGRTARQSFTGRNGVGHDLTRGFDVPEGGYVIVNYGAILPLLDSLTADVSNLLAVDRCCSQQLLLHCRWNKEKLLDMFLQDPAKLMQDCGLDLYSSDLLNQFHRNAIDSNSTSDTFGCRICFDQCNIADSFALGCAHRFCHPCYRGYLSSQISDGPACIRAKCPFHGCKQAVTRSVFSALLGADSEDFQKYNVFITRNFIETSRNMRYCPSAGCDRVVVGSGITSVRCECQNCFCFRCGEEAHDPCTCSQLTDWSQKCMNESETANWIIANTKKCPACDSRIEKNQGCNHMTCKLCKHEFCWICMGAWSDHSQATGGFYKCNRFDPDKKEDGASGATEKAKQELERYLHYYQRFHGHGQAHKYASTLREMCDRRTVQQDALKSEWIDADFLKQATEQVMSCRRVLKFTYVLGYYMDSSKVAERQLFEHHQEMLEKNTERLQEYTEQPLGTIDRTQVINLTRVTEKFMQSLLQSLADGDSSPMITDSQDDPAPPAVTNLSADASNNKNSVSNNGSNGSTNRKKKKKTADSAASPMSGGVDQAPPVSSSSSSSAATAPATRTRRSFFGFGK